MDDQDREELVRFINRLEETLKDMARRGYLDPDNTGVARDLLQKEIAAAFNSLRLDVRSGDLDREMDERGLSGRQLKFKTDAFHRAASNYENTEAQSFVQLYFYSIFGRDWSERLLQLAGSILESLSALFPAASAIKEFVDAAFDPKFGWFRRRLGGVRRRWWPWRRSADDEGDERPESGQDRRAWFDSLLWLENHWSSWSRYASNWLSMSVRLPGCGVLSSG